MSKSKTDKIQTAKAAVGEIGLERNMPKSIFESAGVGVYSVFLSLKGMFCFLLIVLGVAWKNRYKAQKVVVPLFWQEIAKCGLVPLPMVIFLSFIIGFLVVGQSVVLLNLIGDSGYSFVGDILVLVIFKEIGPLLAALVVLIRAGASTVVELAGERASGKVDALVSMGIDPIHYYVIPRVFGMGIATQCLTVYLIALALLSGYVVVFFMDVTWKPLDYIDQVVAALQIKDFFILFFKTLLFGSLVAIATSYESLARRILPHQIPLTIVRTVIDCLIGWGLIDVLFYFI